MHVDRIENLRVSLIGPGRDWQVNGQRLDKSSGSLLTFSIDSLFDRRFISFENNGKLLISPVAHCESMRKMGVGSDHVVRAGDLMKIKEVIWPITENKNFYRQMLGAATVCCY